MRYLVHHRVAEAAEEKKNCINSITARAAAQARLDANLRVSQPLKRCCVQSSFLNDFTRTHTQAVVNVGSETLHTQIKTVTQVSSDEGFKTEAVANDKIYKFTNSTLLLY